MSNQKRSADAAKGLDQIISLWSSEGTDGEAVTKGEMARVIKMTCDLLLGTCWQFVDSQDVSLKVIERIVQEQADVSHELDELTDSGGREPWRESLRPDSELDDRDDGGSTD